MDALMQSFPGTPDADLMLCLHNGVAYQIGPDRVSYDADYLAKVEAYEDTPIAQAVNAGRCALLLRHLPIGSTVLDIGAGSGAFVRAARSWGLVASGTDVIPAAVAKLQREWLYSDAEPGQFDAVTLWDVIEHVDDPEPLLRAVRGHLFVSLPIFDDLTRIRSSRHYRPGEHLHYWTADGFVDWMAALGFRLIERSSHETDAGRDSIGAFAFIKERK